MGIDLTNAKYVCLSSGKQHRIDELSSAELSDVVTEILARHAELFDVEFGLRDHDALSVADDVKMAWALSRPATIAIMDRVRNTETWCHLQKSTRESIRRALELVEALPPDGDAEEHARSIAEHVNEQISLLDVLSLANRTSLASRDSNLGGNARRRAIG